MVKLPKIPENIPLLIIRSESNLGFAKANNIMDERYAVTATNRGMTPGDPRQFYAGLEYRW